MIRALIIAGGALLLAVPAAAQTSAPAEAAPDAARLAAARPVVEKLWPLGTYRRMMGDTMSKLMDGLMASMFDMRAADILPGDKDMKAAAGDKSMGEMAQTADPHFRERMKITMDVMMGEMIPMMEKMEPAIQNSLTTIYARKFDARQLADMNAFFVTPSGKAYAEQSMLVFMDPEMIKNMQAFAPEFLKAMPDIMAKVEKATAHLPAPPKRKEGASDDD
jgi:hypothetical protein